MTEDSNNERYKTRFMYGRTVIYSDVEEVTRENVLDVLHKSMMIHDINSADIDYLYKYYRGNQPIIYRQKKIRPEINNKLVLNHANEIVSFKTGYLCGEPIQYVNRSGDEDVTDQINTLNEYMFAEDKAAKDEQIVEWANICGTAYRMVLPDSDTNQGPDEAPFELYTLDPRFAFVVYSVDIKNEPLMGVRYYDDSNYVRHYSVYTNKLVFNIVGEDIKEVQPNPLGAIPIFEYPANNSRIGSFEVVISLLDALNIVESNRLDNVEQIVQSFLKFINCDIADEDIKKIGELGAVKVKSTDGQNADVDTVSTDLNQDQVETLKKDLYDTILVICGMPNRNGGSSTSDTGAAVIMRDGWSDAESRAKNHEHMFKLSEKPMLKLVLRICNTFVDKMSLKLSDIELKFTRRNYEAIQSKSQVLISMLQQDKIHPKLAFESSGLFIDPEAAYTLSAEYYEEQQKKLESNAAQGGDTEDNSEKSPNANGREAIQKRNDNSQKRVKGKGDAA